MKRPDLLVFTQTNRKQAERIVAKHGGPEELPFFPEENLRNLLDLALLAIECENSLWKAQKMPQFGTELTPQKRSQGQLGLKKNAVLPTVYVKHEDLAPLLGWQNANGCPIHVWQIFYDFAYGISLDNIQDLIESGKIEATRQVFQSPGGATTEKMIYKIYYHYAYPIGKSETEPNLIADYIEDKNGHILPFVRFHGGQLRLSRDVLNLLDSMAANPRQQKQ